MRDAAEEAASALSSNDDDDTVCMTVTGTNGGEHTSPYVSSADTMPAAYEYTLSASVEDGYCS